MVETLFVVVDEQEEQYSQFKMLSKKFRISRKNFPSLFKMRKFTGEFFVIYYKKEEKLNVSVVIPKKVLKLSVQRHLLKRQIYSLFQNNLNIKTGTYIVFPNKKSIEIKFDILKESFINIIKQI